MPGSSQVAVVVGVSLALGVSAAACGASGGPTGPVGAPPPRVGAVDVDPPAGPIGTLFTLTAGGLRQGEAVGFEITFPDKGKAFPGTGLVVPADGKAVSTYLATTANPPGAYLVRLTGPPGRLAEGRFTVSGGPPVTSAVPGGSVTSSAAPSTTRRAGSRGGGGRTTTTAGRGGSATTSTSTRSSSTTPTTSSATTPSPSPLPPP